jgi:hypothetical protein
MGVSIQKSPPMATLGIFADGLQPEVVNGLINVEPNIAARKGDALPAKPGRYQAHAKTGTWFLTTKGRHLGERPEDHLKWVMELIKPVLLALKQQVPGVQVDLSLLVHDPYFKPSHLPINLLESAVAIGELEIEVPEAHEDWIVTSRNIRVYLPH